MMNALRVHILLSLALSFAASTGWGVAGEVASRNGLNLRQGPNGRLIKALPRGTDFTVISQNGDWMKIQLANGTVGHIWKDGGIKTYDNADAPESESLTVKGNYNLRSGAGTNYRVLRTLKAGETDFEVLSTRGEWLRVKLPSGQTGYIHRAGVTEAQICPDGRCGEGRTTQQKFKDAIEDVVEQTETHLKNLDCYTTELVSAAKKVVRNKYGNRPNSGGVCAKGVRQILDEAGMNNGAGLGHAIDFHARGRLAAKGFVNRIRQYPRPDLAPPGAILVFAGPYTSSYLSTGRMSRPYGNYVGHVTVKGDNGKYYTDGRTDYAAGRNRALVGVYVLEDPSKLPAKIRRKCG